MIGPILLFILGLGTLRASWVTANHANTTGWEIARDAISAACTLALGAFLIVYSFAVLLDAPTAKDAAQPTSIEVRACVGGMCGEPYTMQVRP